MTEGRDPAAGTAPAPGRPPLHAHAIPPPPPPIEWTRERLEGYFRAAAFAILLLIGAIATLRLYYALEQSIVVWLRPQWVPLAQAGFSLVLLVVVVWLIRAWIIARAK